VVAFLRSLVELFNRILDLLNSKKMASEEKANQKALDALSKNPGGWFSNHFGGVSERPSPPIVPPEANDYDTTKT
jgi:hypothetical protein